MLFVAVIVVVMGHFLFEFYSSAVTHAIAIIDPSPHFCRVPTLISHESFGFIRFCSAHPPQRIFISFALLV
jgi:hypothetical protein